LDYKLMFTGNASNKGQKSMEKCGILGSRVREC
jgi:hypothetical protein